MSDLVIGRDGNLTTSSKPTSTKATSTQTAPAGLTEKINTGLSSTGVQIKPLTNVAATAPVDFVTGLTADQVKQITPWLKKFGASKTEISTVQNAKKTLQSKFSVYVDNSGGSLVKLLNLFQQDYIPSSSSTAAKQKGNGVTQYITAKDPKLVTQLIDDTLLSTIGTRVVDPKARKQLEKIVSDMVKAGTTTTSTMDKNGKTTVTQTAGYSDEAAKAAIEAKAKVLAPKDYERQQGASFFDWMQKADSLRGGQ